MLVKVYYPSGIQFEVEGKFDGLQYIAEDSAAVFIREGERVFALDPRGVYRDNAKILYNPREARLPSWAANWLSEHPEWPGVLEL